MLRLRAILVATIVASCGGGTVPEELFYGPNARRLAPRPFPPGPEGPWLETSSSGRPRDDGLLFDRGMVCIVELDEDPYERYQIDCECVAAYRFQIGHVEITGLLGREGVTPTYVTWALSDDGNELFLGEPGSLHAAIRAPPPPGEFERYVRPEIMFDVDDCSYR